MDHQELSRLLAARYGNLRAAVEAVRGLGDRLLAGEEVSEGQAQSIMSRAVGDSALVRAALTEAQATLGCAGPIAQGIDATLFEEGIAQIREALEGLVKIRSRDEWLSLHRSLKSGTLHPRAQWRSVVLERKLEAAEAEVSRHLAQNETLAAIGGPTDLSSDWVWWFLTVANEADLVVGRVADTVPKLIAFLETISPEEWLPSPQSVVDQLAEPSILVTAPPADHASMSATSPVELSPKLAPADGGSLVETGESGYSNQSVVSADADAREVDSFSAEAEHCSKDAVPPELWLPSDLCETSQELESTSPDATVPYPVESADGARRSTQEASVANPSEEVVKGDNSVSPCTSLDVAIPVWIDFQVYRDLHWVDEEGCSCEAPWTSTAFYGKLLLEQEHAVLRCDWPLALLSAKAIEKLSTAPYFVPSDFTSHSHESLLAIARFATGGTDLTDELSEQMASSLSERVRNGTLHDCLVDKTLVFLAMTGRTALLTPTNDAYAAVEHVGFSDAFKELISVIYEFYRAWTEPEQRIRNGLVPNKRRTVTQVSEDQSKARARLASLIKSKTSAPQQVRIQHCRKAWSDFMQFATLPLHALVNGTLDAAGAVKLRQLQKRASEIFDQQEVRYEARNVLDRAVDELQCAAARVQEVDAEFELLSRSRRRDESLPAVILDSLKPSVEPSTFSDHEKWFRALMRSRFGLSPVNADLYNLPRELVLARPALIEAWSSEVDVDDGAGLNYRDVTAPLLAMGHILASSPLHPSQDVREWMTRVRPELLSRIRNADNHSRQLAESAEQSLRDDLDESMSTIRCIHSDLLELASPESSNLSRQRNCLITIVENARASDLRLILSWAKQLEVQGQHHVARSLESLVRQAVDGGMDEQRASELAGSRQYTKLHFAVRGEVEALTQTSRACLFRYEADELYPSPLQTLRDLQVRVSDANVRSLLTIWLHSASRTTATKGEEQDRLRDAFSELVFDATVKKRKSKLRHLKAPVATRIDSKELVSWLLEEMPNPTFFPRFGAYAGA